MNTAYTIIIPARFASSRLPGKPLREIAGRPMIAHVIDRALAAGASRVVVATDHAEIAAVAAGYGVEICMTRSDHATGSDRLAECVEQLELEDQQIVVNLQGDEPEMPASCLREVASVLQRSDAEMATLATAIASNEELLDPSCVKLVLDSGGRALYFSRAPIPWDRTAPVSQATSAAVPRGAWRHIGLYAYRAGALRRFAGMPAGQLEQIEMLEQLRALEAGWTIRVAIAPEPVPAGIDTEADLAQLKARLEAV